MPDYRLLSIIVPVYNERNTVGEVVLRFLLGYGPPSRFLVNFRPFDCYHFAWTLRSYQDQLECGPYMWSYICFLELIPEFKYFPLG